MGARFTADSGTELPARTVRHYSAAQEPSGQGTDAIEACFTDDLGNEVCDEATKEVGGHHAARGGLRADEASPPGEGPGQGPPRLSDYHDHQRSAETQRSGGVLRLDR